MKLLLLIMVTSALIHQIHSRRNWNKQRDRPSNRRYSRWNRWSPCPAACKYDCYSYCVQTRYKSCIKPELCQTDKIKDERKCGQCVGQQQDQPAAAANPAASQPPNYILSIRAQQNELQQVQLITHCLPDYHFSSWGNWSDCFDVCRRVRFRHCTTSLCTERVPHMEDPAVKQEEWCLPEKKPDSTGEQPNCHQYVNYNRIVSDKMPGLSLRQCETMRRRMLSQQTQRPDKEEKVEKAMAEGSVLDLGVSCGLRNTAQRSLRIIGGKAAKKGRWPWQVAIMIDKRKNDFSDFPRHQHLFNGKLYFNYTDSPSYVQYCGGTLINNNWVLTAAHCVKQRDTGLRKPNMVVMVGETDMRVMKDKDNRWQNNIYKISKVIDHSRFEWESVNNDIALLKLEKSVPNTPEMGFSCVPGSKLEVSPGTECTAVGWGKHKKYPKQRASKRLKEVVLPLVSRQNCKDAFNFTITKNQMCAGYADGRSDSCDGDSGGPLLCMVKTPNDGERWAIYGITSFGSNDGCGIAGKYGVYTKVNNYSKWIKSVIDNGDEKDTSKTGTEERKRRHRKQKRKREKDKATSGNKIPTVSKTTLSAVDEKLMLIDSLYRAAPARRDGEQRSLRQQSEIKSQTMLSGSELS